MGITGLLPMLKSIQQPISISELSGSTIAIDAYCWLHKGAYGCALQLAEGNDSDLYIKYVMRRVNMILYYKVKPILVFDGGYLPSKSEKEAERRQKRKENRLQGIAHLKNGNKTQALESFQKAIDISPQMALNVIKACRARGVDCIVAPYEADAQLAYLMKIGIAQYTISEDSDLLVFGCEKVIFKMDANGQGLLIDLKHLPNLKGHRMDGFTQQKFRAMCILSGCDYLPSVKGMGLITAHKLLRKHSNIRKLISTLRLNTNMRVPKNYEAQFEQAEQTFLYQVVFDPNTNKLVPLNPLPDHLDPVDLFFAGHNLKWKQEDALDLAIGNLNPLTGIKIDNSNITKALFFEHEDDDTSSEKEKKAFKTAFCPQVKKSQPITTSNKPYELAEKNLNGTFRETKSSEKANSQFVTPIKSKRSQEKSDGYETSKLARLYSTSNEEVTVDVSFETTQTESALPQFRASVQPQLKKRRRNPFRSPVIQKLSSEPVVSRYFFGLAGMEVSKTDLSSTPADGFAGKEDEVVFPEAKGNDPREHPSENNLQNSSTCNESENINELSDGELQESGYVSSSQSNTPKENNEIIDPLIHTPITNSPSTELKNFQNCPPLPKFPTKSARRTTKSLKLLKKRSKSNQLSLDTFAYAKSRAMTVECKPGSNNSSGRQVLADRSPPNCKLDEQLDHKTPHREKVVNEDKKENFRDNLEDGGDKLEVLPALPLQSESNAKEHAVAYQNSENTVVKTQPKIIGLRSKPTTGLGRCRSVGLSRIRKMNNTNNTAVPLLKLNYFEYQRRDTRSLSEIGS